MIPVVAIVGGAALVIGVVASWWDKQGSTTAPPAPTIGGVPVIVLQAVANMAHRRATSPELRAAAAGALQSGQKQLAAAFMHEANVLEGVAQVTTAASTGALSECLRYRSPWAAVNGAVTVSDDQWTTYVRRSRVARPGAVSPDNRMGAYGLTARELSDIGVMDEAHKSLDADGGGKLAWRGEWAEGRCLDEFLRTPAQQYDALEALSKMHAAAILLRHRDSIGATFDGIPASLSGLMGVARRAGMGGFRKWVSDAKNRAAFPDTTACFARMNNIF